ncbi:MAG: esterase/lipase family protein [Candidatus Binataceae bacterium]
MPAILSVTADAAIDFARQLATLLRDPLYEAIGVPAGDGSPVLLIPGYFAGDWLLQPLARWLKRAGYRPHLSGIDLNVGCPQDEIAVLDRRVVEIARESNRRVAIIGHSWGGIIARMIAIEHPERVSRVIALGSPVRAGWVRDRWTGVNAQVRPALHFSQSIWRRFYGKPANCGTAECACGFRGAAFATVPPQTRFTAIYSRRDEMANWRDCADPAAANYEVGGLHVSLVVNRDVYRLLGGLLADRSADRAAA